MGITALDSHPLPSPEVGDRPQPFLKTCLDDIDKTFSVVESCRREDITEDMDVFGFSPERTIHRLYENFWIHKKDMANMDVFAFHMRRDAIESFRRQVRTKQFREVVQFPCLLAARVLSERTHEHLFWLFINLNGEEFYE